MLKTFKLLLYPLHSDTVIRDCLIPRCSLLIRARYPQSYGLIALRKTVFCHQAIEHRAPRRRCYVSQRFLYRKCCSEQHQGLLFVTTTATRTHVHVMRCYNIGSVSNNFSCNNAIKLRDKLLERLPNVTARSFPTFNNDGNYTKTDQQKLLTFSSPELRFPRTKALPARSVRWLWKRE